jgi:roadblock/LC7 domain-containing protein
VKDRGYSYKVDIQNADVTVGATYKVTANVTITNHSGHLGTPFGPSPSATDIMPTATPVHSSLNVTDTNGASWAFTDSGSQTYSKKFSCDTDAGTKTNTVTSAYADDQKAGPTASAQVTVNCYALAVTKTANTSLTRTYAWTINKSADQSSLTLTVGQTFNVNYTISVTSAPADSNWAATGQITVHNPAPIDATINSVTDALGNANATVTCPGSFPYTLAAGGDLICSYTLTLPDATGGTNNATATLQNHADTTPSGTTDFKGTAAVDFSSATVNTVDATASVSDNYPGSSAAGLPATVNASDTPKTFTYTRQVGPYASPGSFTVDNTATVVTKDTGTTGDSTWTVNVNVPSAGCTLTIGYWKTHPDATARLLPIWLGTPGGLKSIQVITATQATTILSFNGDASNGINKLDGQLLAAKLSIATGADSSAVASTISAANVFLATHNSGDWASLTKTQKTQVLGWATTLDNYNNGLTGPGHCSQ